MSCCQPQQCRVLSILELFLTFHFITTYSLKTVDVLSEACAFRYFLLENAISSTIMLNPDNGSATFLYKFFSLNRHCRTR